MTELRGLSVKVPIRFSDKAQRDLYETCMGYKKLAEVRGEENERLRELCSELYEDQCDECDQWRYRDRMCELGIEVLPYED